MNKTDYIILNSFLQLLSDEEFEERLNEDIRNSFSMEGLEPNFKDCALERYIWIARLNFHETKYDGGFPITLLLSRMYHLLMKCDDGEKNQYKYLWKGYSYRYRGDYNPVKLAARSYKIAMLFKPYKKNNNIIARIVLNLILLSSGLFNLTFRNADEFNKAVEKDLEEAKKIKNLILETLDSNSSLGDLSDYKSAVDFLFEKTSGMTTNLERLILNEFMESLRTYTKRIQEDIYITKNLALNILCYDMRIMSHYYALKYGLYNQRILKEKHLDRFINAGLIKVRTLTRNKNKREVIDLKSVLDNFEEILKLVNL